MYPACPNEKCRSRKVQSLESTSDFVKCQGCKATFASENFCETGCTAVVTIREHESNGENKYTIFTEGVKKLLQLPKQLSFGKISSLNIEEKIFDKLPISCTVRIRNSDGKIIDIISSQ